MSVPVGVLIAPSPVSCTENFWHIAEDAAKVSLPVLLNHINTIEMVQTFEPSVSAAKSVGAPFFMGETNSAACHGLEGVSNTLGAALWMLDYSLTGATIGMDGLYFHNGVGFPYSGWQPVAVNGTAARTNGLSVLSNRS